MDLEKKQLPSSQSIPLRQFTSQHATYRRGRLAVADVRAAVPDGKITVLQVDLDSLRSVQNAAKKYLDSSSRLDILFNNAGVMAAPAGWTEDGYEILMYWHRGWFRPPAWWC